MQMPDASLEQWWGFVVQPENKVLERIPYL